MTLKDVCRKGHIGGYEGRILSIRVCNLAMRVSHLAIRVIKRVI